MNSTQNIYTNIPKRSQEPSLARCHGDLHNSGVPDLLKDWTLTIRDILNNPSCLEYSVRPIHSVRHPKSVQKHVYHKVPCNLSIKCGNM